MLHRSYILSMTRVDYEAMVSRAYMAFHAHMEDKHAAVCRCAAAAVCVCFCVSACCSSLYPVLIKAGKLSLSSMTNLFQHIGLIDPLMQKRSDVACAMSSSVTHMRTGHSVQLGL